MIVSTMLELQISDFIILLQTIGTLALVFIVAFIAYWVTSYVAVKIVSLVAVVKPQWREYLLKRNLAGRVGYLASGIVVSSSEQLLIQGDTISRDIFSTGTFLYLIFILVLITITFVDNIIDIYHSNDIARQIPLTSFGQGIKIFTIGVALLLTVSHVLDIPIVIMVSGLGATLAVAGFIFKDVILGFVAALQVVSNKMIAKGDWIEMPEAHANGTVVDINLTSVTVQNWNQAIVTVPTYWLVSQPVKNWRGIQEADGRRFKRQFMIDLDSIKPISKTFIEKIGKLPHLPEEFTDELDVFLDQRNKQIVLNITIFRSYVLAYLRANEEINNDMNMWVVLKESTGYGQPIEVLAFTYKKKRLEFEQVQGDIFEHIYSAIPTFDLKLFQGNIDQSTSEQ